MIVECRRQFEKMPTFLREPGQRRGLRAEPGQLAQARRGGRRISIRLRQLRRISTAGAQSEMVLPALLAIILPSRLDWCSAYAGVMGLLAAVV